MNNLNVLISCLFFKGLTGSEMHVLELSKALRKIGCNITITSPYISDKMVSLAQLHQIKVIPIDQGAAESYDIIHCQHKPVTEAIIKKYPTTKKICTIHSEVMSHGLEDPVKHKSIKHYIAIRPEIKSHLIQNFGIKDSDISVIYNPIDNTRFKPAIVKQHNAVLFVGTVDYLRRQMLYDLVEYTKQHNKKLWLVGDNNDTYLSDLLQNKHVKYSKSVNDVEEYTQRCEETAGVLLGRSTIEGWMCNKPGWIYDIDKAGNILSKQLIPPLPEAELKAKFWSSSVATQVLACYKSI